MHPSLEPSCDLVPSFLQHHLSPPYPSPTIPQPHSSYPNFPVWLSLWAFTLAVPPSWNASPPAFCVTGCILSLESYFQCYLLRGATTPSKAAVQPLCPPLPILILWIALIAIWDFSCCLFMAWLLQQKGAVLATGWELSSYRINTQTETQRLEHWSRPCCQ